MRREALRAALRTYEASGADEVIYRQRMIALCDVPDPFDRSAYAPGHFTASGFVLSPDNRAVVLIFHRKLRRWLQPGGHIDHSDPSPESACLREVQEECNISGLEFVMPGIFDLDIHQIPARGDEPAHEHFDLRYLLRGPGGGAAAGSDAEALRFVALDQVHRLESDESVLRAVARISALSG